MVVMAPGPGASSGGRLRRAGAEARKWVEDSWGSDPRPAVRLGGRAGLHGSCLVGFGALLFPAIALFWVGSATDLLGMRVVGTSVMVVAAFFIAVDLTMVVRLYGTTRDFSEWDRSGRPDVWVYRGSSQPRSTDVIGVAIVFTLLAAFFVKIMLG
jgi:hypothetical protein